MKSLSQYCMIALLPVLAACGGSDPAPPADETPPPPIAAKSFLYFRGEDQSEVPAKHRLLKLDLADLSVSNASSDSTILHASAAFKRVPSNQLDLRGVFSSNGTQVYYHSSTGALETIGQIPDGQSVCRVVSSLPANEAIGSWNLKVNTQSDCSDSSSSNILAIDPNTKTMASLDGSSSTDVITTAFERVGRLVTFTPSPSTPYPYSLRAFDERDALVNTLSDQSNWLTSWVGPSGNFLLHGGSFGGAQTYIITSNRLFEPGFVLPAPISSQLNDPDNFVQDDDDLYLANQDHVAHIDLATGQETILADFSDLTGRLAEYSEQTAQKVVVNHVADEANFSTGPYSLWLVDKQTGDRQKLADDVDANGFQTGRERIFFNDNTTGEAVLLSESGGELNRFDNAQWLPVSSVKLTSNSPGGLQRYEMVLVEGLSAATDIATNPTLTRYDINTGQRLAELAL